MPALVIAGGAGEGDRGIGERGADLRIETDRGRDLDHLLMAALHGAIALVEVQDVAVLVAEDLHFDVLGAADEALEEDGVVAEGGGGFAARLFELAGEIGGLIDDAHAAAAAAEGGLDDQRDSRCWPAIFAACLGLVTGCFGAGHARDAGLLREAAGGGLVAEQSSSSAVGPTKVMPARSQARGRAGFSERKP